VSLDRGDHGFVSRTELAADGTFVLQANAPGTYRLQIDVPMEGKHEWTLLDAVRLESGTQRWEQDLPTGGLRVLPRTATGSVTAFDGKVRWQGPAGLRVFLRFARAHEATREVHFPAVPVGPIQLVQDSPDERKVLLESEVVGGETRTVQLP
jgi:hypothetical protein